MKREQGFTLIELLAVIVILAIIALIATPLILGVIEDSRKNTLKQSLHGIMNAGDLYVVSNQNFDTNLTIMLPKDDEIELDYNGSKPDEGYLNIDTDGNREAAIIKGKYCAYFKDGTTTAPVIYTEKDTDYIKCTDVPGVISYKDCFDFDETKGSILRYYPNNNDSTGEKCGTDNIVIPSKIKGIKIKEIGPAKIIQSGGFRLEGSFYNLGITGEINLPDTIEKIGAFSFSSNKFSGDLILNDNIKIIEEGAFQGAFDIGLKLKLPSYLTEITTDSFSSNYFSGELILPVNIEKIGSSAFQHNSFRGKLNLPDKVKNIGNYAFSSNKFSQELDLPYNLATIGEKSFAYNEISGDLSIPVGVKTIGGGAFNANNFSKETAIVYGRDDGVIDKTRIVSYGSKYEFDLVIPDGVKIIDLHAFRRVYLYDTLTIPSSVTTIRPFAFAENRISTVTIDNTEGNVAIGNYAFNSNGSTGITLPTIIYLK